MKRSLLALAAMLGALSTSYAADLTLPVKAPPLLPTINTTCSTQNSCTGWYVGGTLYGIGGNAALLQNGLNNSLFAGGGAIGLNAGVQYWNGQYFAALDGDVMIESSNNAGVQDFLTGGAVGMVHVKLGGNLLSLVSNGSPVLTPPSALATTLMATYVDNCVAIRQGTTQYCGGMGQQFLLAPRLTLDLVYDYGAPTTKLNALQYAGAKIDYHF